MHDQPATTRGCQRQLGARPARDRVRRRGWLDEQWADPATRVSCRCPAAGVRAPEGRPQWLARRRPRHFPRSRETGVRVLLGERDGVTRFALHIQDVGTGAVTQPVAARRRARPSWVGRALVGLHLMENIADARLLFHAVGIGEWLERTRFCARCGGTLTARSVGPRPGVRLLRPRAVPADRACRDHADHPRRAGDLRRALPARQRPAVGPDEVLDAGRLRGAGGGARGRRTPRGASRRSGVRVGEVSGSAVSRGRSRAR
jgi:hypothetical protein